MAQSVLDTFLGVKLKHDHTSEYDSRYVNVTGDTMTGALTQESYGDFKDIAEPSAPADGYGRLWSQDEAGFSTPHWKSETGINIELGRDGFHVVRNSTGATLSKGQVVYISGSTGVYPQVALARADSSTTMPAVGFVAEDINDNSFGLIITSGDLGGFDTSSFIAGDKVYVSTSVAGSLTATPPSGTNIRQSVGLVISSNPATGIVQVDTGTEFNNANIDHDSTSNFVANEHIDHTSVTLTAGEGLTGGGDISSSRSFALDFSDLSTTDTLAGATDLVSIHDGAQKKITFANFEGSLNHDNLTGFVTNEHIDWTNASSNFLTTGSVTGRGTTQFGDASNYVQVSNVGILTMAGTAEYRVASDKAAFKAVADTDAGLFFGVTGGARYYYTDIDGVEMFSIGASTAASGNVTLYGNLAFSSGNYTVADNNYAFVSTADNDVGLFFDGTNFRINMRDNLAADVWGVTVALTDKGAMRWLPRQSASNTAPVDDLTIKKLTIQKLSSAPTNAAYIAFTNNPGTDTFYLVLEEG